ncbi:pyocin knob domain-containing protein, partial [Streptococcus parauberis]|uniref:pyocin knob domain-containing protein n=1 Tax=Streptococcus parauberis TaxID=1348 RepID=UPI000AE6AE24
NEAVGHAINTLPSSKKDGYYLNLSGGEVAHSSSFVTDYIEINSGMTVKVENVYLDASRSIVAYDKEKNPIEPILYGSALTTLSFEVKEGWHYFRATGAIARGDIKAYYTGITQDILDATNNLKFQNKTLSNFEGSKLLTGDDLNNLTFGAYHSSSDTVTKALLNAPKGIRGSLKIIYIPIHDNKGIMYLVDAYSKTYVRQFNGNYWTDWEKFGNGISDPYNRTNIDRTELAPLIESFTPTLATWNATEFRWELDTGGRISADITVEANTPYLITVGYTKGTNQMGTWDNGTLFDVVLGDEKYPYML